MAAKDAADYRANYTKVHMNRDVYELAKVRAKANSRTVANYIAHLVQQEADGSTQRDSLQTVPPVIANIPGSKAK